MTALEQAEKWFLKRKFNASLTPDSNITRSHDVTAGGAATDRPRHVTRSFTQPGTARNRTDLKANRNCQGCSRKTNVSGSPIKSRCCLPLIDGKLHTSNERGPKRYYRPAYTSGFHSKFPRYHGSQPLLGERQHVKRDRRQLSPKTLRPSTFSLPVGMDSVGVNSAVTVSLSRDDVGKTRNKTRVCTDPDTADVLPNADHGNAVRHLDSNGTSMDGDGSDRGEDDLFETPRRSAKERRAQKEVEHNWILRDRLRDMSKHFERRKNHLAITVTDDDAMVVIEKRLEEIRHMSECKSSKRNVLDKYKPEVRELIMVSKQWFGFS